jgi:hypothetical protein
MARRIALKLAVRQATKTRLLELTRPFFVGIAFAVKMVYSIAFAWWFEPWMERKAVRALLNDIKTYLYFLVSPSLTDTLTPIRVVKSEWPEVEIPWENLLFTITRWRAETSVSVAPRHASAERYELGPLIASLEHRHFSERDLINDLADAALLLRPRLQILNAAFSEQEFPRTRKRL